MHPDPLDYDPDIENPPGPPKTLGKRLQEIGAVLFWTGMAFLLILYIFNRLAQ